MNKAYARTGAKLQAHFANAVFDEDTGQMLDYKNLINHNKKETRTGTQPHGIDSQMRHSLVIELI